MAGADVEDQSVILAKTSEANVRARAEDFVPGASAATYKGPLAERVELIQARVATMGETDKEFDMKSFIDEQWGGL